MEDYGAMSLPEEAIVDGKIKRFDQVAAVLSRLVQQTRSRGCYTAIALPASAVIMQSIKLAAYLTEYECEKEIAANVARYLPGVTEAFCVDFVKLTEPESDYQHVMLIAVRQEQLQVYLTLGEKVGLKIRIVDIDSYALLRGVAWAIGESTPLALMQIDRSLTQLIVANKEQIIFSERWLTSADIQWDSHAARALALYAEIHQQLPITTLFLAGDVAQYVPRLKNYVDVRMQIVNPLNHISLHEKRQEKNISRIAPCLLMAFGLATRKFTIW
jgi:Tfp pilus assembly PilM family ATPase